MGLNRTIIGLLDQSVHQLGGWGGIKIGELGNQYIHEPKAYRKKLVSGNATGKNFCESRGAEHISFDINEKDGALKCDLSKPMDIKWEFYFDIVTNCGTTEHVLNQYQVFKNIHNICKPNGIMIHSIPLVGYWRRHCTFHYKPLFGIYLCSLNDYIPLKNFVQKRKKQKLLYIVLKKTSSRPFQSEETFGKGIV